MYQFCTLGLVGAIVVLFLPATGKAGVTLIDQTRSVAAFGLVHPQGFEPTTDNENRSSPGFGFSDEEAAADASNLFGFATGAGTHESDIIETVAATSIAVIGGGATVAGFDILNPGFDSLAEGAAESAFELVFSVDDPTPYSVDLLLEADLKDLSVRSGPGPVTADVRAVFFLLSETDTILSLQVEDSTADGGAIRDGMRTEGTLLPGIYRLQFGSGAQLNGWEDASGNGVAAYGFTFTVPEPRARLLQSIALATIAAFRFLGCNRGSGLPPSPMTRARARSVARAV